MSASWRELAAELAPALEGLAGQEGLEAVGTLAQLHAVALRASLRASNAKLITLDEAADIAQVPTRRVRSWARNKPWAVRLSARTLRVDELAFREWWLGGGRDVHNGHERSLAPGSGAARRSQRSRTVAQDRE